MRIYTCFLRLIGPNGVGLGLCSKSVGYRFGKCLPSAVPVVLNYCATAAESDDEMRESAFQVRLRRKSPR
eukprot:1299802-Pyramimonas_sp.AAC.1